MTEADERTTRDPGIFTLGGEVVAGTEILRAADVRGDLRPVWLAFLAGLSAREEAAARGWEPDPALLEEATDAFRYERGLLTAEETEAWLVARGLTRDALEAYVVREHWRGRIPDAPPARDLDVHEAPPDLREPFRAHLALSGELDRLARALARRMAVFDTLPHGASPSAREVDAERAQFLEQSGLTEAALPGWLARSGLGRDAFERLLAMEVAFRVHAEGLLTPKARERVRQSQRLGLIRVEVETLEVESENAAREAVLCLREDGRSMEALASDIGLPYARSEHLLEDLPEELRIVLLSAAPGDVLPPVETEGGFEVHRLVAKRDPDPADPEILRRVDHEILEAAYGELTAKRVHWLLRDDVGG